MFGNLSIYPREEHITSLNANGESGRDSKSKFGNLSGSWKSTKLIEIVESEEEEDDYETISESAEDDMLIDDNSGELKSKKGKAKSEAPKIKIVSKEVKSILDLYKRITRKSALDNLDEKFGT